MLPPHSSEVAATVPSALRAGTHSAPFTVAIARHRIAARWSRSPHQDAARQLCLLPGGGDLLVVASAKDAEARQPCRSIRGQCWTANATRTGCQTVTRGG